MLTIEFLISAISVGSLYALIALGLVIIYGILKLVNFAYGELVMVAGYALFLLNGLPGLAWFVMAGLAVIAAMVASYLTERVAFRPVRAKSLTAILITSFAVSTLLQNAALLIISPRARPVPLPAVFMDSVQFLGAEVPTRNLITIVTTLLLLGLFTLLLRKTVLGIALRAAADNFRMTRMLGVPAKSDHFGCLYHQRVLRGGLRLVLGWPDGICCPHDWRSPPVNCICCLCDWRYEQPGGGRCGWIYLRYLEQLFEPVAAPVTVGLPRSISLYHRDIDPRLST